MALVNGREIPEGRSLEELGELLRSEDLQEFVLACEALKNVGTEEAYVLLKSRIHTEDKYRRRAVLSVIFCFDASEELSGYFLDALLSQERMHVRAVLSHLLHRNLWVSQEQILCCFEKNHQWLDAYYYGILGGLEKTPQYTERVRNLFTTAYSDGVRIALGECLFSFATQDNYAHLFGLFAKSPLPKLRMIACRIAGQFRRSDLLLPYANDPDGHIRKYVEKALD